MKDLVEVKGHRYATVPEWILDSKISDRAVRLFGVLNRYAGENRPAWPSRKTLATRLDCSVPSIDRSMRELVELGALTVEERRRENGSRTSSLYHLWPSNEIQRLKSKPVKVRRFEDSNLSPVIVPPITSDSTPLSPVIHPEGTLIEGTLDNNIMSVSDEELSVSKFTNEFDELWLLYPRGDNKLGAYEKYNATLKKGATHQQLLSAVIAYAKAREGGDKKFNMLGATFFGPHERWLDFLPVEVSIEMSQEQTTLAQIWEDYDRGEDWTDPKTNEKRNTLPAVFGYNRPKNLDGQYVDLSGKPYAINNAGERVSADYWAER
jgi:hypothetical protein